MERLFTIVRAPKLDPTTPERVRKACRAIVWDNDRLLLVQSRKYGDVKFPGGGAEPGERAFETLCRETAEETGYRLKTRIKPFGFTREYGRTDGPHGTFCNESRYYVCGVYPTPGVQHLSEYEIEHGYVPVWMTPEAAADQNDRVPDDPAIPWKQRETAVLRLLAARKETL